MGKVLNIRARAFVDINSGDIEINTLLGVGSLSTHISAQFIYNIPTYTHNIYVYTIQHILGITMRSIK